MARQPQTWTIPAGDLAPSIVVRLRSGTTPYDLTGCSVQFRMKGMNTGTLVVGTATITDASNGEVTYAWNAGDTDVPDRYLPEWVVTLLNSKTQTWPNEDVNYVIVRARRTPT